MQNVVPDTVVPTVVPVEREVAERAVRDRADAYAEEVRRLIDAAYAVMRGSGTIDPSVRDIVRESGLSNQAFYRHFRGKDELLVAVLDDGQRRLVDTIERRLARRERGAARVRAWVEVMLDQARNPEAAANTRPFAVNGPRLSDRFPAETSRRREQLIAPLREALAEAGGDPACASAIYHLAMSTMQEALARHDVPSHDEVELVAEFAMRGAGVTP